MNPRTELTSGRVLPPLQEVRKSLRIDWYRCPIERSELLRLSEPDDAKGLAQAIGHLGLWLLTGILAYAGYSQEMWWLFWPALFAHGTVSSFLTAPHHELCHGTVFKRKWLNEAFLRIYSLMGWQNFHVYKFSHSYHHRFTLHLEGDREEVMPAPPSLHWLYLLQLFTVNVTGGYQSRGLIPTVRNFVDVACGRLHNPFNFWGSELYEGHAAQGAKAVRWARVVLLFHAVVIIVSLLAGEPIVALLISGPVFIANWLRYFAGVPMHCGLRSNVADFRKCVRTIRLDPFTEFLYWHMNWHLEHHMYAAVPCYNLKKLYDATAHDMPQPRTLIGAWREMRAAWHQQRKDPEYAFDTPVPEGKVRDRGYSDGLAAAMGTLAPRELQ